MFFLKNKINWDFEVDVEFREKQGHYLRVSFCPMDHLDPKFRSTDSGFGTRERRDGLDEEFPVAPPLL